MTQKDIAKKLKVSQKTVSRVLNNERLVKVQTREKILRELQASGYVLNKNAHNLATGRQNAIGLLIPNRATMDSIYFLSSLQEIVMETERLHQDVVFHTLDEGPGKETLSRFLNQIDGLIIYHVEEGFTQLPKLTGILQKSSKPFIVIQVAPSLKDLPCISIDNFSGGLQAVEHLYELGHRQIYCVSQRLRQGESYEYRERYRGFFAGLNKYGLARDKSRLMILADDELSAGIGRLVALPKERRPTGLFINSDRFARLTVFELLKLGMSVPGDFSLIGFNDFLPFTQMIHPYLTSVRQPFHKLGKAALNCINDPSLNNSSILIKPELIVRESCRKL